MDDQRVGALLRVLRIRRRMRQADVARLAGVSDQTISRIERGHLDAVAVATIRRVSRVLEARLDLSIWTRAGDVERMANARHAALVEAVIADLGRVGWVARPEVSFRHAGEGGLVDIVGWHQASRTLLLVEVKTEVVDVAEILGTLDRKRRLGPLIAAQLDFSTANVAAALVVADTTTNHRRIREHRATFRAALPHNGQRLRAFLRRPSGTVMAVAFWSNRHPGSTRRPASSVRRVRLPESMPNRPVPRSPQHC